MTSLAPFPVGHEAHSARTARLTRPVSAPVAADAGAVVVVYTLRGGEQALYVFDAGQRVLVSRYRAAADLHALLDTWCAAGQATPLQRGHETMTGASGRGHRRARAPW